MRARYTRFDSRITASKRHGIRAAFNRPGDYVIDEARSSEARASNCARARIYGAHS